MADVENLKARAAKVRWFNAIDFGEWQTFGREGPYERYPNSSLYGTFDLLQSLDLRGMRCIDIGAGSGLVALGMKKLGAAYVAAADMQRWEAFDIAQEASGEEVDYRIVGVEKLHTVADWQKSFDVVVCSGLMYHMWSPFDIVMAARRLIKFDGIFILQSLTYNGDYADMRVNTLKNFNGDPTTFVVPAAAVMSHMMKAALFDVVARRDLVVKDGFVAFMGKAVDRPDIVAERPKNLIDMHNKLIANRDYSFGGYDFNEIMAPRERSHIRMPAFAGSGKMDHRKIDQTTTRSDFPYNPKTMSNAFGLRFV
jgi:2-polyprenyl-3-methyl-5-hydroxy-6-metoxy-1,4-benzoquinol methylase